MLRLLLIALLIAAPAVVHAGGELTADVGVTAGSASGQRSWIEGGFGRFSFGDDDDLLIPELRITADWRPSAAVLFRVSGIAAAYEESAASRDAGLTEAFAQLMWETGRQRFRARGGMFFLPTTRENLDAGWSSPYAITSSALTTWLGEELRPIGVDLEYRRGVTQRLTVGATVFEGNDTLGALLAWRGFAIGSRLTSYDEVLPLPPLSSFDDVFVLQRRDGTKPFGHDLDGRAGWSGRARFDWGDRANIQVTHLDNRGDRDLYRGEYAWSTSFTLAAIEWRPSTFLTFAAEAIDGESGMGIDPVPAQIDFTAAYLLASWFREPFGLTLRRERFETVDRDHYAGAERNDEEGDVWSVAFSWQPRPALGVMLEWIDLQGSRPESEGGETLDGDAILAALRYRFQRSW